MILEVYGRPKQIITILEWTPDYNESLEVCGIIKPGRRVKLNSKCPQTSDDPLFAANSLLVNIRL